MFTPNFDPFQSGVSGIATRELTFERCLGTGSVALLDLDQTQRPVRELGFNGRKNAKYA